MIRTKNFKDQHEELLNIASRISALMDPAGLAKDAGEARSLLSKLAGTLNVHLTMEDEYLYPKLVAHDDDDIRSTAQKFIDEMGGIKEVFTQYMKNWPGQDSIQEDAVGFIEETKTILNALAQRIEKENNELYAIVDDMA